MKANTAVRCSQGFLFAALALGAFGKSAQAGQAHILCAALEEVVFSCDLQGSNKSVSLCASPDEGQDKGRFHYMFGRPLNIELKFPSQNADDRAFFRSHWLYANTFGHSYSFINDDYKYTLVSIEDSASQRGHSSLIVQRTNERHAAREMTCKPSTVIKTKNESILRRINDWPIDKEIEDHGPPSTRRPY